MGSCLSMSYMIVEIFTCKKVIHDPEIILKENNELFSLSRKHENNKFT